MSKNCDSKVTYRDCNTVQAKLSDCFYTQWTFFNTSLVCGSWFHHLKLTSLHFLYLFLVCETRLFFCVQKVLSQEVNKVLARWTVAHWGFVYLLSNYDQDPASSFIFICKSQPNTLEHQKFVYTPQKRHPEDVFPHIWWRLVVSDNAQNGTQIILVKLTKTYLWITWLD